MKRLLTGIVLSLSALAGQAQTAPHAPGSGQITQVSGNGSVLATVSGSLTSGDCTKADANGNIIDAGAACGSGGSLPTASYAGQPLSSTGSGSAYSSSGIFLDASQYSGADFSVKIGACLSELYALGGGTCDARGLGGTTAQLGSAEIDVGNGTVGIALLLPTVGHWDWNLSTGSKCGIKAFNNSTIYGQGSTGGQATMILDTYSSSVSMDSLFCTNSASSTYVHAEGFGIENNNAGYFSYGLAHIANVPDNSSFEDIYAWNPGGNAWYIENICCGVSFRNVQGYASQQNGTYTTGGYPLYVNGATGSGVQGVSFENSTFNGPQTGKQNIYLTGNVTGTLFKSDHEEGNCTADSTTAMVYIGSGVGGVTFLDGDMWTMCTGATPGKYVFENHTANPISISGIDGYGTNPWINDVANSITVASASTGVVNAPYPTVIVQHHACALGANCALSVPQVTVYTGGSGTYTTPTNATYLVIEACGGGGGGGGSGTTAQYGGGGGNTTFGSSLLTANGGGAGGNNYAGGGTGGTATGGDDNLTGGGGGGGNQTDGYANGGSGGYGPRGGGGQSAANTGAVSAVSPNSCAGGAGAGTGGSGSGGSGGGAGGYLTKLLTAPAATYAYAIGAAGAAGAAGTSGAAGGIGSAGFIKVTAYFQ